MLNSIDSEKWNDFSQNTKGIAFLRRDPLYQEGSSSDWDIAVKEPERAYLDLKSNFGDPITCIQRLYVQQHYYKWGQVDFLPAFIWRGLSYMDLERFWGKVCKDAKGVSRPCLAHDAFLAWITSVLSGGNFNSRHKALVNEAYASDKEEFIWCMDYAFGATRSQKLQDLLEEKDPCAVVEMTKELRRSIFRKHLEESPVKTLKRSFKHWYVELKHHLFPKLPTIAFLGPDGSGKSSVISGLKKELREMRLNCRSLHWRPYGIKGREDLGVAVADPHAAEPRGLITSVLKLGMLFYDWWLASLTVLLHARAKISVVICDRYYNDLLVDTRRYRYGGPKWLAKLVFKFMPRPNLVFILVGTPEIIHPRKQEVTLDELRRQIEAYKELAEFIGESAMLVNVDEALDTVIEKVCTRTREELANRM